ncbi:hypothetical protein G6F46_009052 [Rhizopus delemar]|nr:hypothetical protein G6F55_005704 [Rhizopus delemar]KAG1539363.1 hypothetical protein G6F51_009184 [Rhizopus arrhizus]KAG1493545.1 hypothetical protein G6F54_008501 [Rhizopus delemar]KAG1507619.1 hypothetical protein G6F53_008808 [Rhizopus delemar]KAG1522138.1 hypothetical protein G6F52_006124 [Rhizopus delemar]
MSSRISIHCTRPLIISEDEAKKKEIAELVGLNKSTVQNIKAKIDRYGSSLPYKQTGHPFKINERTERHLKRIIIKDPFTFYKEVNMELAKLDAFVCIETLRSYADRLAFKSYKTAHKPRLTARHHKNVAWSDESPFCVEGSNHCKRVLRKEGDRYDERSIVSTAMCGGDGAMVWGYFWGGGFGHLEMIDTGFVDQETYINTLANRFHP